MSKKVTYTEITEALAQKSGQTKQKSDEFIKHLIGMIKEDLKENGNSSITKFGSFTVKEVAEREGVNPQTGDPITIPAHKRVNFSAYKALKETVNAPFNHLEPQILEEKDEDKEEEAEKDTDKKEAPSVMPPAPAPVAATDDVDKEQSQEKEKEAETTVAASKERTASSVRSRRDSGSGSGPIFLTILVIILLALLAGWFFMDDLFPGGANNETQTAQNNTQTEQPVTNESDEPPATDEAMDESEETVSQSQASETDSSEMNEIGTVEEASESEDMNAGDSVPAEETTDVPSESDTPAAEPDVAEGYQPVYRPTNDDWYWDIANNMYGQPEFWPLIFAANKTAEDDPDVIFAWRPLNIPEMENMDEPTAADYQQLAEASRLVAEAYTRQGKTEKAAEYNRYADRYASLAGQ